MDFKLKPDKHPPTIESDALTITSASCPSCTL